MLFNWDYSFSLHFSANNQKKIGTEYNHATGADGVKIAALRKGHTNSEFI